MTKITLDNLANLQNENTAVTTINDNNEAIEVAFENTLSRDGTAPNQMEAIIDMNGNRMFNLPAPATSTEPIRLADVNTLNGGGTISTLPAGGLTNNLLAKTSNTDFATGWTANPIVTSATVSGLTSNSAVATDVNKTLVSVTNTGAGNNVLATGPTLVSPALGTPASAVLTNATGLPVTTGISGMGTNVATFLATPSSANLIAAMTDETGTGANVFANGPTLIAPVLGTPASGVATNLTGTAAGLTAGTFTAGSATNLTSGTLPAARTNGHMNGTATNDSAAAGEVGEFVSSTIAAGSAIALTSGVSVNITSISLTAGDWEVQGVVDFTTSAPGTTTLSSAEGSLSTTTGTMDYTGGKACSFPGGAANTFNNITGATYALCTASIRFSLSGTTTVFLVTRAAHSGGNCSGYGHLKARRVR